MWFDIYIILYRRAVQGGMGRDELCSEGDAEQRKHLPHGNGKIEGFCFASTRSPMSVNIAGTQWC